MLLALLNYGIRFLSQPSVDTQHVFACSFCFGIHVALLMQKKDKACKLRTQPRYQRMRGSTASELPLERSGKRTCAMCRSSNVQTSYCLLDIYSTRVVQVRVCGRHCLYGRWAGLRLATLQQFLAITSFIDKKQKD